MEKILQNLQPKVEGTKEVEPIKEKRVNELTYQIDLVRHYLKNSPEYFNNLDQSNLKKLRHLLFRVRYVGVAKDIFGSKKIYNNPQSYQEKYPELFKLYGEVLRIVFNREREKIKSRLESALWGKELGQEIKDELDDKTINIGKPISIEQQERLKESFPSGNFLLHTTGIDEVLLIIDSGKILSSLEVAKELNKPWGHAGSEGISFNTNDVRVLTGDSKHFAGFLADPKVIMKEDYRLALPVNAAKFELQLVPKSFDRNKFSGFFEDTARKPSDWGAYPELEMPKVNIQDTFLFCNELDATILKDILSANGKMVKGVITYPNTEVRVGSWLQPSGDHVIAGKLLKETMGRANISPSINWNQDLFPKEPAIQEDTFVSNGSIKKSYSIIKEGDHLEIIDKNGQLVKQI